MGYTEAKMKVTIMTNRKVYCVLVKIATNNGQQTLY